MAERFWNPEDGAIVSALKDWVSQEVAKAVSQIPRRTLFYQTIEDGHLFIIASFGDRPDGDDEGGGILAARESLANIIFGAAWKYRRPSGSWDDRELQDLAQKAVAVERMLAEFYQATGLAKPTG